MLDCEMSVMPFKIIAPLVKLQVVIFWTVVLVDIYLQSIIPNIPIKNVIQLTTKEAMAYKA